MKPFAALPAVAFGLAIAGCAGTPVETLAPATPARTAALPAAYPVDGLVGSWGVASFREEKDRKRTEAMARSQCRNPYVIAKGPTDGVMMHVADDVKLYELTLKGAPDGKTYLGFNAPPGDPQDREVLSFSSNLIVMRFINPEINTRYGTYVYVRCGSTQRS
jgi:hypothetical protein